MTAEQPIIECRQLSYTFLRWGQTVKALQGVSLEVPSGQWTLLIGPNGSGKTTLLRLMTKRLEIERNEQALLLQGQRIQELNPRAVARLVYYVHQDPLLGTAPDLTVYENLLVSDEMAGSASRRELEDRYRGILRPFGLHERLRQPARTLSGGERQLLTLLIANLRPCPIVLLDEPLAALDPENSARCRRVIRDLHSRGKTILQVTHEVELAATLGERTVALQSGRLVYDSGVSERTVESLLPVWRGSLVQDH